MSTVAQRFLTELASGNMFIINHNEHTKTAKCKRNVQSTKVQIKSVSLMQPPRARKGPGPLLSQSAATLRLMTVLLSGKVPSPLPPYLLPIARLPVPKSVRRVSVVPMPVMVDADGALSLQVVTEDLSLLQSAGPADVIRQLNELVNLVLLPPLVIIYPLEEATGPGGEKGMSWNTPCGGTA